MTVPSNFTARNVVVAGLSIALGAWTFVKVNEISGPTFQPILAACTEYGSSLAPLEFELQTGYHAFEPAVGLKVFDVFVCLITQFLYELRQTYPAGVFVWGGVVTVALPFSCMATIEAGRGGAIGPIRYPVLCGLLYQLFGVSVMMPLVWLPSYIFGRGHGGVSSFRASMAVPLNLPAIVLSCIIFVADTRSYLWTLCAGILGGPGLPLVSCVLWGDVAPVIGVGATDKEVATILATSSESCAYAYLATVPFAWGAWAWFVYTVLSVYEGGSGIVGHINLVWNDVWTDANASVRFMTIDTIVLWLGMCLCIAVRGGVLSAVQAVALTPLCGPGAACSVILAGLETTESLKVSSEAVSSLAKSSSSEIKKEN